jgi:hypothetical protein
LKHKNHPGIQSIACLISGCNFYARGSFVPLYTGARKCYQFVRQVAAPPASQTDNIFTHPL